MQLSFIKRQEGSSLIETMISLFLLAIGLLGVLSMQAGAVNSNQRALFRSEALLLANDMVDQLYAIRESAYANAATAIEIDAVPAALVTSIGTLDTGTVGTLDTSCKTGADGCDINEQVTVALSDWNESFAGRLPAGRGRVTQSSGVYTITVHWDEQKSGATGVNCPAVNESDMQCFQMELKL